MREDALHMHSMSTESAPPGRIDSVNLRVLPRSAFGSAFMPASSACCHRLLLAVLRRVPLGEQAAAQRATRAVARPESALAPRAAYAKMPHFGYVMRVLVHMQLSMRGLLHPAASTYHISMVCRRGERP